MPLSRRDRIARVGRHQLDVPRIQAEKRLRDRFAISGGDPNLVVLREHFVEDQRVPVVGALTRGDVVFPSPAAESEFFDRVDAGNVHRMGPVFNHRSSPMGVSFYRPKITVVRGRSEGTSGSSVTVYCGPVMTLSERFLAGLAIFV